MERVKGNIDDLNDQIKVASEKIKEASNDQLLLALLQHIDKTSDRLHLKEKELSRLEHKLKQEQIEDLGPLQSPVRKTFKQPKSLPSSCSKVTDSEIAEMEIIGEIFHHWFAVAMCELQMHLDTTGKYDSFSFLDEELNPNMSCLKELMDVWGKINGRENTHTVYLSCLLDRFLCNDSLGYCLHQVSIPRKDGVTNFLDFCVVPNNSRHDPTDYVAVSDYKTIEYSKAVTESAAYSIAGKESVTHVRRNNLRLFFPCSQTNVGLSLHIPVGDKFLKICLFEQVQPNYTYFCMLYAGVRYLFKNPIKCHPVGGACSIQPSPALTLPLRDSSFQTREVGRVLRTTDNKVYKFFDKKDTYFNPNLSLVQCVFSEAQLHDLENSQRYCYLTYNYRRGSSVPKCNQFSILCTQFSMLCTQLKKIHEKGFVHSDIRKANLVFSESEAWIIDYDLAAEEDCNYPPHYNHLPERHSEALPDQPRKKIHDVYSLDKIATSYSITSFFEKYSRDPTDLCLQQIAADLLETHAQPAV